MPIRNAAQARAATLQNRGGQTPTVSALVDRILSRIDAQAGEAPAGAGRPERLRHERRRLQPYLRDPFAVGENEPEPDEDVLYYARVALEGLGFRFSTNQGVQIMEWGH